MAAQGSESDTTWAYPLTAAANTPIWQGSTQHPRYSGRFSAHKLAWQTNDASPPRAQVHDTHPRVSGFPPPLDPPMPSLTLSMNNLEPWMDHEYVGQVVHLMGWDRPSSSQPTSSITAPVTIKIPPSPQDISPQPNNPGYCLLTFSSLSHAASVLATGGAAKGGSGSGPMLMPNSNRSFHLQWATATQVSLANELREFSIFVGDLGPDTSNSDLVAVFRNPVLGLRNDREPKFIRPFYSCMSARIMLDHATGISKGYGFVRFTDEADQQRALVEMQGLYCISRPMRICLATAKSKPNSAIIPPVMDQPSLPLNIFPPAHDSEKASSQISPRLIDQIKQIAETPQPFSNSSLSSLSSAYTSHDFGSKAFSYGAESTLTEPRDETWTHQAQARAILGNLIGPNGEQVSSTDPYNTTIFVGGLSPLISEETLRTFFARFGDIHYVKVPVGKCCGFVQFVHKADAKRAIELMDGLPIGGSRIRLSWGRSQYKAAQAVAQAAQSAQIEQTASVLAPLSSGQSPASIHITQEQATHIRQTLGYANQSLNTLQRGSISSSACQSSNMQAMGVTYDVSRAPGITTPSVNAQVGRPQYHASLLPFTPSTAQSGQSIYPLPDQQQKGTTGLPILRIPFSSQGYSASASHVSGLTPRKFIESNSPNSSAASSSGSSGRFDFRSASSAFGVNSLYYENGAFQANDLLRRNSHSLISGMSLSSPSHSRYSVPMSSRFQQLSQVQAPSPGFLPEDDGALEDLNGTLACLDLGGESYMACSAVDRGDNVCSSKNTSGEGRSRNESIALKQPSDNLHM